MKALLLSTAAALFTAAPAFAQDGPAADQPETVEAAANDEIVVTGSRAPGRSRLDSLSPVDVLSGETLTRQGTTEIAEALAAATPSIVFPRPAVVDGTDSIRPATLRGLSPDQTLVLINGVRGHASALVNVNGSVGRGSAAVDLNTIPGVALGQIEVLRDGASAQYGSDAIAGVINLRLREERSGGGINVTYGQYVSEVDTARDSRSARDGETATVSGWAGFGLGAEGFLTLSAEYLSRNPTSRGDLDTRATPARVRSRFGDPDVEQATVFGNFGVPLGEAWQLYGWAGYQQRDSESAAFPRVPSNVNNVPALYPDGFLPLIAVRSRDLNSAFGVRGALGGWKADLNLSYGRNRLDFRTLDSLNSTYGAASPTEFDDGALIYDQFRAGLDLSRELPLGAGTINVAGGLEYRREGYGSSPASPNPTIAARLAATPRSPAARRASSVSSRATSWKSIAAASPPMSILSCGPPTG